MTRGQFKRFVRRQCADAIENRIEQLVTNGALDPHTGLMVKPTDEQVARFLRSFYRSFPDLKPRSRNSRRKAPVIKHELDAVVFALSRPKRA